jgi:uncharacterized protein YqcC (DUF446 family)
MLRIFDRFTKKAISRSPVQESILAEISKIVDSIETELKGLDCWSTSTHELPEDLNAFQVQPFELWLQLVLIPSAREAVADGRLAAPSQVAAIAMREHFWADEPRFERLLGLLATFDGLVNDYTRRFQA